LQIEQLNHDIQKLLFSIEFVFREFYIKEKIEEKQIPDPQTNMIKSKKSFQNYLNIVNMQIQQGQPFEIIDGDDSRFIYGVYE
jgi:hypothetical protein